MRRTVLLGLAGLALAAPSAAAARELQPLEPPATPPSVFPIHVHDRVLRVASAARAALPHRLAARGRYYRAHDGTRVFVAVSRRYKWTRAKVQTYVNLLPRLHGRELSSLKLVIETPGEIARDCSRKAQACYRAPGNVLRIPGEDSKRQPSRAYLLAHEYGHHIAWHRSNAPFPAILFGPKRWASREDVCRLWARDLLFPGDEGGHYFENPGEAWAEAYAETVYGNPEPWHWTPLLKPHAAAFGAVRADVHHPWRHRTSRAFSLTLARRTGTVRRTALFAPLDGYASLRVRASRRAAVRVRVFYRGHRLAPTRRRPFRAIPICGFRRLELRVTRLRGRGAVRVTFTRP